MGVVEVVVVQVEAWVVVEDQVLQASQASPRVLEAPQWALVVPQKVVMVEEVSREEQQGGEVEA